MGERVLPSVVVGKEEQGTVRASNNKGVHIGKFGTMRDGDRFDAHVIGQSMHRSRRDGFDGKDALLKHQSPLGRALDE